MKASNPFAPYDIPLQAMLNGEHCYSYRLEDDFFGLFEASLITKALIQAELQIHRQGSRMDCQFVAKGTMEVGCARCLETLNWPVQDHSCLVVQISDHDSGNFSDEMVVLPSGETAWNAAHFMYESIHLHYPLRAVCQEASLPCRSKERWAENDLITFQTSEFTPTDPRWDTLKQVNFK
jgi:uncharacterized metal-binding protein YceD (DUF177 family)